jgi:hypothetical protein
MYTTASERASLISPIYYVAFERVAAAAAASKFPLPSSCAAAASFSLFGEINFASASDCSRVCVFFLKSFLLLRYFYKYRKKNTAKHQIIFHFSYICCMCVLCMHERV